MDISINADKSSGSNPGLLRWVLFCVWVFGTIGMYYSLWPGVVTYAKYGRGSGMIPLMFSAISLLASGLYFLKFFQSLGRWMKYITSSLILFACFTIGAVTVASLSSHQFTLTYLIDLLFNVAIILYPVLPWILFMAVNKTKEVERKSMALLCSSMSLGVVPFLIVIAFLSQAY